MSTNASRVTQSWPSTALIAIGIVNTPICFSSPINLMTHHTLTRKHRVLSSDEFEDGGVASGGGCEGAADGGDDFVGAFDALAEGA